MQEDVRLPLGTPRYCRDWCRRRRRRRRALVTRLLTLLAAKGSWLGDLDRFVDRYIPRDKWAGPRRRTPTCATQGSSMKKRRSSCRGCPGDRRPGQCRGRAALLAGRSKTAGGRSSEKMRCTMFNGGVKELGMIGRSAVLCVTPRQRPNDNNHQVCALDLGTQKPRAARDEGAGL